MTVDEFVEWLEANRVPGDVVIKSWDNVENEYLGIEPERGGDGTVLV